MTKFKLCPPTSLYFCTPTISVTHLHRRRGDFGRPWAQKSVHVPPAIADRYALCTFRQYTHCIQKWKYRRQCTETLWWVHRRYKYAAYLQVHAESATPPTLTHPKKLFEFVQISWPTLVEVGWARAHPWLRQCCNKTAAITVAHALSGSIVSFVLITLCINHVEICRNVLSHWSPVRSRQFSEACLNFVLLLPQNASNYTDVHLYFGGGDPNWGGAQRYL